MTEPRKLRVFLCHASQDKPIVRELYQRLLAEGWIDPWLDEEKLLPGQDWGMAIEKAVENSDIVVVCLSNKSVRKDGYIQRELRFALDVALEKPEGAVFIVPVRLDDCDVPRSIRFWQFTDYFPVNKREKSLERLLSSLRARAESIGIDLDENKKPGRNLSKLSTQGNDGGSKKKKIPNSSTRVRTDFKVGKTKLTYVPAGNSVGITVNDSATIYRNDIEIKPQKIPYDYWVSHKVVTVPGFKMFMQSTKYEQDIAGLYKYSKKQFYISLNDALAYITWMNVKYKERLPAGYIFSLPSNEELIRAIVAVDLEYIEGEFVRENVANKDSVILEIRGSLDVGDFHLAVVPMSILQQE